MAQQEEKDQVLVPAGGAGLGAAVAAESGTELGQVEEQVQARGYWELVWRRFRRDKVAIASGIFIILLILVAFGGAPLAKHAVGHGPNDLFLGPPAVTLSGLPANPWTHVQNPITGKENLLVLGSANRLGQDEFLRLLYGARISLEVAILSTIGVMIIGVLLGSAAGYFRGTTDTLISRLTEITMAFPLLIFVISLAATVGPQLDSITLGVFPQGVLTLVMIFTLFGWFYPARIMRAQALSIREKEYVEAARMIGASDSRIIRSHILPHLVAPMIVYATLTVASFILLEAGLSFLGVGIKFQPSWGNLLSEGPNYYTTRPLLMLWPGLAVLLTTLAFNLLGDGLRDAFDPRATSM
jgi:ABC-type dipeptide/oligopeptide/nickel transport system permease subunit